MLSITIILLRKFLDFFCKSKNLIILYCIIILSYRNGGDDFEYILGF